MKKHILIISQYFHPEQFRINDICLEWVNRGYEVTVVTGIPNYPFGNFYNGYGLFKRRTEFHNGIRIIRLPIIPRGKSAIMLALNYVSYVVSGYFWQLFTSLKADIVYIYEVSPMTQALPGVWYAKKRNIPCYIYVTDLWPENVEIVTGIKNKRVLNSIGYMVDYIYKHCNRIFTSSKSFVEAISKRGIDSQKIEFWPQYAEEYYKPIDKDLSDILEIPLDDQLNITFAGNIGFAQGLSVLPKAAQILKQSNHKIRFNIIGDGRFKKELIKLVHEYDVSFFFNFIDKKPAEKIPYYFAKSDAALICLSKSEVFSITIPAKTQSCLACGIPILVSADGEIQRIILDSKSGLCSAAEDAHGLADIIAEFSRLTIIERMKMSENALEYSRSNFNKKSLMDRMDEIFKGK